MARGFESKDVEFQQAEAERTKSKAPGLELALARAEADLAAATSFAHRRMLEQAIAALRERLVNNQ